KAQACTPPAATPGEQQTRFDAFRTEFNDDRPHEALDQRMPSEFYERSTRPYPAHIDDPAYGSDDQVRRVRSSGEIKWRGEYRFIGEALVGEAVAVTEREDGHWLVRFADVPLVLIDRYSGKIARFTAGRPSGCKSNQPTSHQLSGI
ncbi:MAG TPA: transposase, partial [Alphaproteobacteria bacterium]|nr:transposase [Alphaproteobacteria bacterium]